jgi:aspartate/methionine/tyrosine aminotransferase
MRAQQNAGKFYTTLTEAEVAGLGTAFDLANGHAYHDFPAALRPVIEDLPAIWSYSASRSVPDMEEEFKRSSAEIFGSLALTGHPYYSICPTASNSIDIVATWLHMRRYNVGLLEPVFDNLYLILRRRGLNIESVREGDLLDLDALESKIRTLDLKSLFIVTPNNPTGFQLDADEFGALCGLCARMGVTLIVDKTFRLYSKRTFDSYKILNESGVGFVVVEDTGKTWPTQDTKVSLMVYSESLAEDLRTLYEEIFLCSSNFTLAFLKTLIEKTRSVGVDKVIHREVSKRTLYVERALSQSSLVLVRNNRACSLPLAWIDCSATGLTDLELVRKLKEYNIALLPGRFFYWASQEQHTSHVRLSLMKPNRVFYKAVDTLSETVQRIVKMGPSPMTATA